MEAAFPYCGLSIRKSRIIQFGSTGVHIGEVTGRFKVVLFFYVYVKVGNSQKQKYILQLASKGEQFTAELGAKTVLKQTNELCFYRQKLPSSIVIGQSKWLGSLDLAQQVL